MKAFRTDTSSKLAIWFCLVLSLLHCSYPQSGKAQPAEADRTNASKPQKNEFVAPPRLSDKPPPGFDLPAYSSNITERHYSTMNFDSTSESLILVFKSKDSPQSVFDWYDSYLAASGWQFLSKTSRANLLPKDSKVKLPADAGEVFMLLARKKDRIVNLSCLRDSNEPLTMCSINISRDMTPPAK